IYDGTAVLTAILLALAMPTLAPWWLAALGAAFAIVIAKHLYGGMGYNPFNPAMVGYAMLLIAFPKEMTAWIPAETHGLTFSNTLNFSLFNTLPEGISYDALTMATPLDSIKTQLSLGYTLDEIHQSNSSLFGNIAGYGWEWINIMFLIGGLILVSIKVISWHIPVAVLGALSFMAILFNFVDSGTYAPASFHLFGGAAMLGAFFIATDPVTAAASTKGRLIYGAGIGILIYIIRTWGGYPDAIAFSVLLMNMAVPMIDYYYKPAVFGATGKN
ncbi:MAG: RnfABCDGE type electron transport complex subunit D, partial [Gammaproteobacteria bacterium]|nr:RnfABCDGE type electron transport complex subunit D [Gammaproteobacteria bacterium]